MDQENDRYRVNRERASASAANGEHESPGHEPHMSEHQDVSSSGVLRASIFGVSDGLVSNVALVMGVAAGASGSEAVVLAGTAGLFAGAFSMATGEYVSMQIQREHMERELRLEREHLIKYPKEEEAHLVQLLQKNGLEAAFAERLAAKVHENLEPAVDFHALLELGINARHLGSPIRAAVASFGSFVIGALVPLIPWFFTPAAFVPSVLLSAFALLIVGGAATRVTRQNFWKGASRQLAFGTVAAVATFAIGFAVSIGVTSR